MGLPVPVSSMTVESFKRKTGALNPKQMNPHLSQKPVTMFIDNVLIQFTITPTLTMYRKLKQENDRFLSLKI